MKTNLLIFITSAFGLLMFVSLFLVMVAFTFHDAVNASSGEAGRFLSAFVVPRFWSLTPLLAAVGWWRSFRVLERLTAEEDAAEARRQKWIGGGTFRRM